MTIREATTKDVAAVIRLYGVAGLGDRQFSEEEARAHFARFAAYPQYRLYLAEKDGDGVGTYALLIMDNLAKRGQPSGVIEDVAVDPEYQRQGIGRTMMAHAIEQCRQAGCYKVVLSSNVVREEAHRFYEDLGFERHGYSFRVVL